MPLPLSAVEIDAWCRLTGIKMHPLDFRTIREIDAKFVMICSKARAAASPGKS